MSNLELPPLERVFVSEDANDFEILYTTESVEARERILLARIAELEADASRYRWLRDECDSDRTPSHCWILESPGDVWDAAIDAAMAKGAGS